ncbi:MAG: N-acetylmuramoyl-L-alanine amidase [Proteobacteria bacterium]|nr:N-acetylmuramoyl-L-alanine amidase [Pseudomonadota bacterium]
MPKSRKRSASRHDRVSAWTLALLCLALTLSALAPCALTQALGKTTRHAKTAKAVRATKVDATPADAPVRSFLTLLTRKSISQADLSKLEDQLEQARKIQPEGLQGAKASFFLARVHEEMARKSGLKADWFKAAESFGEYLKQFPKHILAPDALIRRGSIRLTQLANPEGAQADFQSVLREHPRSSRVGTAKRFLRQAAKAQAGQTKPGKAKPAVEPDRPRGAGDNALLLDIRPKNSGTISRIVLDLDQAVRFKYQLLESSSGKEEHNRVYVDLLGTRLGATIAEDTHVGGGGLLRTIRAAQRDDGTVRVVFDFADLKDYKVQTLDNPFRIVLDAFAGPNFKPHAKEQGKDPAKESAKDTAKNTTKEPDQPAFAPPSASRKRMAANLVEQLGLSVRTIMIDAGHGGKDPGAQGHGLSEKDVNLRMALALGKVLKSRGFKVIYTRTTDVFLALEERTAMANAQKADLFLSVHCNAHTDPSMSGLETYSLNLARTPDAVRVAARENSVTDKNISDLQMILTDLMLTSKIKESVDLAHGVHKRGLANVRKVWTVADHGNREAPFYVLMGAKMPSALLEIGYITNKTEAARLNNDAYLRTLSRGIADGVKAYKDQIERYASKQ